MQIFGFDHIIVSTPHRHVLVDEINEHIGASFNGRVRVISMGDHVKVTGRCTVFKDVDIEVDDSTYFEKDKLRPQIEDFFQQWFTRKAK